MILSTQEIRGLLGHAALSSFRAGEAELAESMSRASVERVAEHGDLSRFSAAIQKAQAGSRERDPGAIRAALTELAPWRKGPFDVSGVTIDAEWDSRLKWDRLRALGLSFDGHSILDIGAGNGFYARKLEAAGAELVVAVEQSVLYAAQFMALQALAPLCQTAFLVLRAEQIPESFPRFDSVLSMGVLYHVRSPIDHLMLIRSRLKPGGQAIVETIALDEESHMSLSPSERYANMRNVWFVPTVPTLENWLRRTGFRLRALSSLVRTTSAEQRSTPLAPGPSLAEALDAEDPMRTREGYPGPLRVIAIAEAS